MGPGVRHVQTCCWGAAYLILEVAETGSWKGADISDHRHLHTKSKSGGPWRSGFQATAEDVLGERRWREMRRPNSAPLRGGAHTLVQAQLYQFSPLTFLLRSLGVASAPFAQVVAGLELQLLTPRRWGKGNPAGGWRFRRGPVLQYLRPGGLESATCWS